MGEPDIHAAINELFQHTSLLELFQQLQQHHQRGEETDLLMRVIDQIFLLDDMKLQLLEEPFQPFLQMAASAEQTNLRRILVAKLGDLVSLATRPRPMAVDTDVDEPMGDDKATEDGADVDNIMERFVSLGLAKLLGVLVLDRDTGVAERALDAIVKMVGSAAGSDSFFEGGLLDWLLDKIKTARDETRLRILDLFVSLGSVSETTFDKCEERGLYELVLQEYFTDDLLIKLIAVELMDKLGSFPHGARYMARAQIPLKLARELRDPLADENAKMSLVRLLANIIVQAPDQAKSIFSEANSAMAEQIQEFLSVPTSRHNWTTQRLCGINAWGDICISASGREQISRAMPHTVDDLIHAVRHGVDSEICKAAMAAWTKVLEGDPLSDALMAKVSDDLLPKVLDAALVMPFADIRPHAYRLLAALSQFKFTARAVCSSEDARNLLVDWHSEQDKFGKYAKHEWVSSLVSHHEAWLPTLVDEGFLSVLETYAKSGPFYIPPGAAASVAEKAG